MVSPSKILIIQMCKYKVFYCERVRFFFNYLILFLIR